MADIRRFSRPQWAVSIAASLVVVGFVAAAQWNSSGVRQQFTTSAQQVLARQVLELQHEESSLTQQLGAKETQIREFQAQTAGSQTTLDSLNHQLAAARLAAGLARVQGPGVIVEIADSKRIVPIGDNPASFIVLVDDLRDLVTALWASGAEAVSINGERLVATSSVYGVGSSILVNTAFLSPPFRIEAIGPAGLLERFQNHPAFVGRVKQRIDAFGLEFAVASAEALDLEPFVGSTRLRWATPVGEQL